MDINPNRNFLFIYSFVNGQAKMFEVIEHIK